MSRNLGMQQFNTKYFIYSFCIKAAEIKLKKTEWNVMCIVLKIWVIIWALQKFMIPLLTLVQC